MVKKPPTKSKEEQDFDDQITMYLVGKPGVKPSEGWYQGRDDSQEEKTQEKERKEEE